MNFTLSNIVKGQRTPDTEIALTNKYVCAYLEVALRLYDRE